MSKFFKLCIMPLIYFVILVLLVGKLRAEERTYDVYMFMSSKECPECHYPLIKEEYEVLSKLEPKSDVAIVYYNGDNLEESVIKKKFDFADNVIFGEEAEVLYDFYGINTNESRIAISINDTINKTIFLDDIYKKSWNLLTVNNKIKKEFKTPKIEYIATDLNKYGIENVIFMDENNADSTIIFDYNNKKVFLYNNKIAKIDRELFIPDSIKRYYFDTSYTELYNSLDTSVIRTFFITYVVSLRDNIATLYCAALNTIKKDTTYGLYEGEEATFYGTTPIYITGLLHYNLINNTCKLDTNLPIGLKLDNKLATLSSNENFLYSTAFIPQDTLFDKLNKQFNFLAKYNFNDSTTKLFSTKLLIPLLEKPFLERSMFGVNYIEDDDSFIVINYQNKLLFNIDTRGRLTPIKPSLALAYRFADDEKMANYSLVSKKEFNKDGGFTYIADDKYIYFLSQNIEIPNSKENELILQKYTKDGKLYSEEIISLEINDITSFNIFKHSKEALRIVVKTKDSWGQFDLSL